MSKKVLIIGANNHITGFFITSPEHQLRSNEMEDVLNVVKELTDADEVPNYKAVGGVITPLTPAEKASELTVKNQAKANRDSDEELLRKLGKLSFFIVNELRALQNKPAITMKQFKTFVTGL